MHQISKVLCFILLLVTIGLVNTQEVTGSQIDFDAVPTSLQADITKAMNRSIQKSDEVWLCNPYFKSHFTAVVVAMSPSNNDLICISTIPVIILRSYFKPANLPTIYI